MDEETKEYWRKLGFRDTTVGPIVDPPSRLHNEAKQSSEKLYGFSDKSKGPNLGTPPPKPPPGFYPRKPAFWQIRGTRANVLNYGLSCGFVVAGVLLGAAMVYWKQDRLDYWAEYLGISKTEEELQKYRAMNDIQHLRMFDDVKELIPDIDDTSKTVREKYFEMNREKGLRSPGPPKPGTGLFLD